MGFFDDLKGAAGDFLGDAKDDLLQDAQDHLTEATGLDKVTDAVSDVTDAKESVEGAFDTLREDVAGA
jgi:hypothetical protein